MGDRPLPFCGRGSFANILACRGALFRRGHDRYRLRFLFRVRAPFLAARERFALLRLRAAERLCRDKARRDAAERGSRLSALFTARERVAEGFLRFRPRPLLASRAACFLVRADVLPFFGGGSFTPARRAFDNPIAMACLVERAPCFPSRICSISSRTNSPA